MSAGGDAYVPPAGGGITAGSGNNDEASKAMDDAELERVFKHFDGDGSGAIDVEELRSAMQALGIKVTMSSAKKVLAQIDKDNNGTIEWEEFYDFFQKVRDPEEIRTLLSSANQRYLDYKMMVEGDPNFERRFYVPTSEKYEKKFFGHEDNVEDLAWVDPHSNNFITCSLDGYIKLWDVSTGKKKMDIVEEHPTGFYCLNVIENGSKCLSGLGSKADNLILWDLDEAKATEKKNLLQTFIGHTAPVYCVSAEKCQNEKFCVSGAKNGTILYHDMSNPEPICTMEKIHEGVVYSVDFNEDCTTFVSSSSDGTCRVMDLRAGKVAKTLMELDDVAASGVCFKAIWRGEYELLSCGDDYCVKKWDTRYLKNGPLENYLGHTSPVRTITMSQDQKHVCSATNDGCIRIWVVDERKFISEEMDQINNKLERMEKERTKLDAVLGDMDAEEEVDEEKLRTVAYDLEKQYRKSRYMDHVFSERQNMNCVQARMGLDGHTLPVQALAWRDNPADNTKAQILSGSQDQLALSFNVTKPKTQEFIKWTKDSQLAEEAAA